MVNRKTILFDQLTFDVVQINEHFSFFMSPLFSFSDIAGLPFNYFCQHFPVAP